MAADTNFKQTLWKAAEYKHIVLGLIFLKLIGHSWVANYRGSPQQGGLF